MTPAKDNANALLNQPNWIAAVIDSSDVAAVRQVIVRCAQVMLPYWEARFDTDEKMGHLITLMAAFAENPAFDPWKALNRAIPRKRFPQRDLSPIPGMPDIFASDCTADEAGDAITFASMAMGRIDDGEEDRELIDSSCAVMAFETSIQGVGRLLAERDPDDELAADYLGQANEYLRTKMLELGGIV